MEIDFHWNQRISNINQKKEKNLNDSWLHNSVWNIGKEIWHALAIVSPTNGLGEHHGHVNTLNLVAILHVTVLWNRVCHHNGFEASIVDAWDGWTAEDSMGEDGKDLGGSGFEELLGSVTNGSACVCHVVDENRDSLSYVTDEHHGRDLVRLLAFFVDQSELDIQSVSDRRDTFRTTGIWRHDNRVSPVGDVLFDPLQHSGLGVEVVDWNVEETLKSTRNWVSAWDVWRLGWAHLYLRCVKIHGYYMVCPSNRQHVGNQLSWNWCSTLKTNTKLWSWSTQLVLVYILIYINSGIISWV